MGGGVVPPYWGPDSPEDSGSWPAQEPARPTPPGSTWLRLGVLVGIVVLVVLAAIVALTLAGRDVVPGISGGGDDDASSSPDPTPTPVQATVSDFDPDQDGGTPSERPEQVPLATDGDKTTAWTTEKYFDGPALAPYKDGVGLMFDLGRDTEVRDLVADLGGSGYSVQLLAAPAGTTTKPTSTEGLKTVASRQGVGGRVVLTPGQPVKTRYVVLWLTALPQVAGGYQGSVLEVVGPVVNLR